LSLASFEQTIAQLSPGTVGAAAAITGLAVVAGSNINAEVQQANPLSSFYNNTTAIFPSDLVNSAAGRNFYMTFWFYQYQRPTVFSNVFPAPIGQIVLPLPANMVDNQSEGWQQTDFSLNPAVGAALDQMLQQERAAGGGLNIQSILSAVTGAATGATQGFATAGTQNLLNTAGLSLGVTSAGNKAFQLGGLVVNPYMTVLFNSPNFKRHTFNWKFIPVNQQEADTLKLILNKFRFHRLPDSNAQTAGTLLNYPDMVFPVISPAGYMYSFKFCVIESMAVNFVPGIAPGFTAGPNGFSPSAVELSLNLLEIEYWLKGDFNIGTDPNYTIPNDVQQPTNFGL
jgi:hypothetical protein